MGKITINHWKIIQSMLERGVKPDIEHINLALDKADPMPDDMQQFIKRIFLDQEKGLLSNRTKRLSLIGMKTYIQIIVQDYGNETATDFKARICTENHISPRTLEKQLAQYEKIFPKEEIKKRKISK